MPAADGLVRRDVLARGEAAACSTTSRSSRSPTCSARPRAGWAQSITTQDDAERPRPRKFTLNADHARSSPRTAARSSPAPARSAWSPTAGWSRSATTRIPRSRRARSARSTACATRSPATWRRSRPTARSCCSGGARTASTRAARRSSPRRSRRRSRCTRPSRTRSCSACPTSASATGRRRRVAQPAARRRRPTRSSPTPAIACRATSCPRRCGSSPPCRGPRTARPTTAPARELFADTLTGSAAL